MFLKENKKDKKWWYYIIGILEVILDIISDPITSVGFRIFFGGLFILAGLLLLLI
mgnify:CR=1 FL=1